MDRSDGSPLISVVVPVFRVEKYLERCVRSIMAQTWCDIEIILVDDGSDDRCPQLCDGFAAADNRVRVIHKPNGGLSSARNAGIEAAAGGYLMFIDSDDCIEPEMAEKLYRALIESGADMSVCGYRCVGENGEELSVHTTDRQCTPRQVLCEEVFRFTENYSNYWNYAWNKLYKRELFDTLRYPEGKTYEDVFVSADLYMRSERIVFVPDILYNYLRREDSITGRPWSLSRFDLAEARFRIAKFYSETPGYEEAAKKTLLSGTDQMYSKAASALLKNIGDRRYRARYRELQKLLRQAYRSLIKCSAPMDTGERAWLFGCRVSWMGVWAVRRLFRLLRSPVSKSKL